MGALAHGYLECARWNIVSVDRAFGDMVLSELPLRMRAMARLLSSLWHLRPKSGLEQESDTGDAEGALVIAKALKAFESKALNSSLGLITSSCA